MVMHDKNALRRVEFMVPSDVSDEQVKKRILDAWPQAKVVTQGAQEPGKVDESAELEYGILED